MKIAVECKSPLLQKSLEIFLSKYLTSYKQCDIVVRDEKCLNDERCFCVLGDETADLKKPFSKSQLILALQNKYESMSQGEVSKQTSDTQLYNEPVDFEILQNRIEYLTKEYQQNIIKAIKAFYEK